jgi:Cu2+-exporting ATPase
MLDESLPRPRLARLVAADGPEVLVPIERLRPGDQILVDADEAVPADGRVVAGEGIVDERSVRGLAGASRKRAGDELLAGSTVLAGSLRVEIAQSAEGSLASTIGRALVAATSPAAGPTSPTLSAEAFAEKAVGPTLATAGVGLLLGGLGTAGAILRPDYATGPGLSSPMQTLRDVARCARRGIVVRAPDAFERLAACDVIVLDDAPALHLGALDVVGVRTRLPEAELLRYAASAFLHVADERSAALVEACRERKSHLLDLPALDLQGGVTIAHGDRRIRVRDQAPEAGAAGALIVEADGATIGLIEFGRTDRPAAAPAVRRLRAAAGVPIVLVSGRSRSEVAALAAALGVDAHQDGLAAADRDAWLASSRSRGLSAAFVGDGAVRNGCEVAVSLGGDIDASHADAVLLRPDLDLLVELWEVASSHANQARSARRLILLPNLLCVTGAFLFGATPLTSVMVSNLGTLGLYGRAVGSLRGPARGTLSRR